MKKNQVWWHMPGIQATWEIVQGNPDFETGLCKARRSSLKNQNNKNRAVGRVQVVEPLPSNCVVLGSVPCTTKKERIKRVYNIRKLQMFKC
jgi:hypothetical protein